MNNKWEYTMVCLPKAEDGIPAVEHLFNDAGKDSWELVTIINHPTPEKLDYYSESSFFAVFKRQKS